MRHEYVLEARRAYFIKCRVKKQNKIKWVINERQFLSKILLEIYGKAGLSSFKSPILDFVEVI